MLELADLILDGKPFHRTEFFYGGKDTKTMSPEDFLWLIFFHNKPRRYYESQTIFHVQPIRVIGFTNGLLVQKNDIVDDLYLIRPDHKEDLDVIWKFLNTGVCGYSRAEQYVFSMKVDRISTIKGGISPYRCIYPECQGFHMTSYGGCGFQLPED